MYYGVPYIFLLEKLMDILEFFYFYFYFLFDYYFKFDYYF